MSTETSPHFVTSDDEEGISQKHRVSPVEVANSVDITEISFIPHKKPRIPAAFRLVSYGDDDDDEGQHNEDNENSSFSEEYLDNHSENGSDTDSRRHRSADNFDVSDDSRTIITGNGPLTVLSLQHKLSDVNALRQTVEAASSPKEIVESLEKLQEATDSTSDDIVASSVDGIDHTTVSLPPEPPGVCDSILQMKVDTILSQMRFDITYDPNTKIQDNKHFRNPSMYEKLIAFLKIDEKGTNFLPDVYNPYRWSSQSYYDELSKIQNQEVERLEKIRKEQRKANAAGINPNLPRVASGPVLASLTSSQSSDQHSGADASVTSGFADPKKRSKWDTAQATNSQPTESAVPGPVARTGTDPTAKLTIPAVGSLFRKK